jgi:hypothetical protein
MGTTKGDHIPIEKSDPRTIVADGCGVGAYSASSLLLNCFIFKVHVVPKILCKFIHKIPHNFFFSTNYFMLLVFLQVWLGQCLVMRDLFA